IARFDQEIRDRRVVIHRANSADTLPSFPDEYFDWVYIDGNHLFEFVRNDLELSFRKVKVGGYVAGDDYFDGGWWRGGVKRAVDEFATTASAHLLQIRNGQYIFEKR